ncbi:MAG TPA: dephospho-CoA kinase [Longimicrobiales bacterium]|nr:dephospho-CoA kinase [Longimicrobiales bacterium]
MSRDAVKRATSARAPYRVGLTGNIAAGKSEVAAVWRDLGAAVVDADALARRAVERGSDALRTIAEEFGEDVLVADGSLDRAALARIVFADPERRRRLEAIVHPQVARLRPLAEREALAEADAPRRGAPDGARRAPSDGAGEPLPIVVHDIPLLFETGLETGFDEVVVVDAPEDARLERLVELRGMEPRQALQRIASQMPSEDKVARADRVIRNDASLQELRTRAAEAWRAIEAAARTARERAGA